MTNSKFTESIGYKFDFAIQFTPLQLLSENTRSQKGRRWKRRADSQQNVLVWILWFVGPRDTSAHPFLGWKLQSSHSVRQQQPLDCHPLVQPSLRGCCIPVLWALPHSADEAVFWGLCRMQMGPLLLNGPSHNLANTQYESSGRFSLRCRPGGHRGEDYADKVETEHRVKKGVLDREQCTSSSCIRLLNSTQATILSLNFLGGPLTLFRIVDPSQRKS